MSNTTKFIAALGLCGAMLVPLPAAHAQTYVQNDRLASRYPVIYDDYYATTTGPGRSYVSSYGSYGAYGAYAAFGPMVPQPYTVWGRSTWPGLSSQDWTAIHGAGDD